MHCNAGNIVTSPFDLARVQPDTNVETELARAIAEGAPALDRSRRTVKCRQKPVAKALYPTPAEATHLTHCHIVVLVEQLPPGPVTGQRGASGRVDDVAEENRREYAVRARCDARAGEEFLDLTQHRVGATDERQMIRSVQLDQLGLRNVLREVTPVADP